jgi:hypothetical protein
MGVVIFFDYRFICRFAYVIYAASIVLLVLVSLYGYATHGSQRWIILGGFFFQPSELVKLSIIIALAKYFDDHIIECTVSYRGDPFSFYFETARSRHRADPYLPYYVDNFFHRYRMEIAAFGLYRRANTDTAVMVFLKGLSEGKDHDIFQSGE